MKNHIFAFAFFIGLLVSSGTAQAQVVTGGGGGLLRVLFPRQSLPCKDGELRNFQEKNTAEGHHVYVQRVCRNGRFFQKSNVDYKRQRCSEGTVGYQNVYDPEQSILFKKTFRCINGERVLIRVQKVPR